MSDCTTDPANWATTAAVGLLQLRNADGGWPYRPGDASSTEPTALAAMALASLGGAETSVLTAAADWLVARQREDGLFTASPSHLDASWTTPLAAMALSRQGRAAAADTAVGALLAEPVYAFNRVSAPGVYGYDTNIPGWPWTSGDFSFVEPTALAVVFLKRAGQGAAWRVRRGADMLRARAFVSGGWNYGEPRVLGGDLFPTVSPTAAALLALADEQDGTSAAAANWLAAQRGQISSLFSLGWATIALNILNLLDDDWRAEVRSRWCALPPERQTPMETALCLLGLALREDHPFAVI